MQHHDKVNVTRKDKRMSINYNVQIEKLCNILNLGELNTSPKQLSGGLLHRMYSVTTTTGKYAIKALNPNIMARSTAKDNYINSERTATVAATTIPAQPAITFNGTSLQEIEQQYYLIFCWIDGSSIKYREINKDHCKKIGSILSKLHKTDFTEVSHKMNDSDYSNCIHVTDWTYYLEAGKKNQLEWVQLMEGNINNLYEWSKKANQSASIIASDSVISHRDLEPKNVLWHEQNPIVIDWESAGKTNVMLDFVETAIYWSVDEEGSLNSKRFLAFKSGYESQGNTLLGDWKKVLEYGYTSKLEWLEYNLKRSLWMECSDEKEQQLGTSEVTETIKQLREYDEMTLELDSLLHCANR